MPSREDTNARGRRRGRSLSFHIATELGNARRLANLSRREVGRRMGIGHELVGKLELGNPEVMTIDLVSRFAEVVGRQLAASLHLYGDPVRDRAQLALIGRFRPRLGPILRWRTEVPIPITADPRSADGLIEGDWGAALVEAETRVDNIQAIERKARAKQRDLGAERLILLVADTRHNRRVLRDHPELREHFPVDTRTCLASLGRGKDPDGDCLVIL